VSAFALPLEGGCACHAIRYRVTARPLMLYACHCTDCQRHSGSAFNLSLTVARDHFVLTSGSPKAWQRVSGDAQVTGWFCADCGSRLYGERSSRPTINVRAGTLDDTSWLEPGAHIYMRSAQPWETIANPAICFDAMPPDFAALAKAWQALIEPES
jgi:hypothetical protein